MKHGKIPRELEFMFEQEPRPELREVDSSSENPFLKNRGQDGKPCPHILYCNVKPMREDCKSENRIASCQTYKFYERYGKEYNQMFI
jgi:hypothetical protein